MKENYILEQQGTKVIRCSHCGGAMRYYRDGVNCLLCGRTLEHRCDSCKHPEYMVLLNDAQNKKVA